MKWNRLTQLIPDELYIVADPPEDADNYYFIKVTNGEITNEKVIIPKNP